MRFLFGFFLLVYAYPSFAQTSISPLDCVAPFYHGVASGDPLQDAVIIWTRVTPEDFASPVVVSYKMALDTGMTNIVAQGSTLTDASKDFTVKFDVTGLTPDQYYYYEFFALDERSPRGRTKTAPLGGVDSLRFAVVSCANLEAGYFNVYEVLAERNDFEAVLMLGDYIYEYEVGGYGQNPNIDRIFDPTHETIELEDYRLRYSVYHMDRSLQRLHQNFPWICVWDDHESANDSYKNGAQNHNAGEGLWSDRKLAAQDAYFEWLPIRPKAPGNHDEIYRKFAYGDVLDLFMVDTRLHGRDQQGVNTSDPNRSILGADQYAWLTNELTESTAQWKILGNQVIFAPITVFGIPINQDAWDGYPVERQKVLNYISQNAVENFAIITGDVHTSWAFDLKNGGQYVGVEFVTPSVTSPGSPINGGELLMLENPHLKFVELTKHGFILLDINEQRLQADWFFVNTIDDFLDNGYYWQKSFYTTDGTMQLMETTSVALPGDRYDVLQAPLCPRVVEVSTAETESLNPIELIGVYPNPANDKVHFHFSAATDATCFLEVLDMSGRQLIAMELTPNALNSTIQTLDISAFESGMYTLRLSNAEGMNTSRRFQKL